MEREIKFRHPIFVQGKFIEWHYWGFIEGGFESPAIPMNYKNDGRFMSFQFIGLKDKNDSRIYESDIVKDRAEMLWLVVWDKTHCGFRFQQVGNEHNKVSPHSKCEIVGNIYENPELLETV